MTREPALFARDWLRVASNPTIEARRVLLTTPHGIAVTVAHQRIEYGHLIAGLEGGQVLRALKRAVFRAVRDAVTEYSAGAP